MNYVLYGDGVHDDTLAIQEMIDRGTCELRLPMPKNFYLISKPLELPSSFCLVLPRYAEIRLADGSNCVMIRNKMVRDYAARMPADTPARLMSMANYVDDYADDCPCENIELRGGIWNCNNEGQKQNPLLTGDYSIREFWGFGMLFYHVKNLTVRDLTVKDPINFGITLDTVSYFTVENLVFDYNLGNPNPVTMDGVHVNGNCHFGTIRNLKGRCYDDLVALNADEGSLGPITNIEVSGIYAEGCHSAVRLLTVKHAVEKIHISNVFGTYYQYVIGLTKFYKGETTGYFDAISIDHVYASKSMPVRKGEFQHPPKLEQTYPIITVDGQTVIKNFSIGELHRREEVLARDTIRLGSDARVDRMLIDNVTTTNATGEPMVFLRNKGTIRYLSLRRVDVAEDEKILNEGNGTIVMIDESKGDER